MEALLLYGVAVAATRGEETTDYLARTLGMAREEILADEVALLLVCLARLVVHVDDNALSVADCHGAIHFLSPFVVFHCNVSF